MKVTRHFARRFHLLRLLRGLLGLAGALWLAVAVATLVTPGALARLFGVPFRAEPVSGWLFAAFLAPFGGLCVLAARDPRRYSGAILLILATQLLAALSLGIGAVHTGNGDLWLPAGSAVALAGAIAAAWLPLRI